MLGVYRVIKSPLNEGGQTLNKNIIQKLVIRNAAVCLLGEETGWWVEQSKQDWEPRARAGLWTLRETFPVGVFPSSPCQGPPSKVPPNHARLLF